MFPKSPASFRTLAAVVAGLGISCAASGTGPVASYDPFTSRLIQLSADLNGDGRRDQWTFMDGTRPVRAEADTDGDGRIDRWEYYASPAELVKVGTSSRSDGIEDTWTWAIDAKGERRVDLSRARDRAIDRREYFQGDALARADEDANLDGRPDKWERYEAGELRQVDVDTTMRQGRPDRRLVYDSQGRFVALSADPDGDGTFEPIREGPLPDRPPGDRR